MADRRQKREIRQLEQELHKWQVLVDSITGEEASSPGGAHFNSSPHPGPLGLPGWVHPPFPAPAPFPQQTLPWLPAFHLVALKGGLPPTELLPLRHELSGL